MQPEQKLVTVTIYCKTDICSHITLNRLSSHHLYYLVNPYNHKHSLTVSFSSPSSVHHILLFYHLLILSLSLSLSLSLCLSVCLSPVCVCVHSMHTCIHTNKSKSLCCKERIYFVSQFKRDQSVVSLIYFYVSVVKQSNMVEGVGEQDIEKARQ